MHGGPLSHARIDEITADAVVRASLRQEQEVVREFYRSHGVDIR